MEVAILDCSRLRAALFAWFKIRAAVWTAVDSLTDSLLVPSAPPLAGLWDHGSAGFPETGSRGREHHEETSTVMASDHTVVLKILDPCYKRRRITTILVSADRE
ncbi:hypothetical protein NDU88_000462 [Pleurodeles waltl]|uniref:Uncharacterized protein n=1 Tax=Pleurodeles waltl TaxID=8319 RepID=A0AAV7TFM8_PLEWA|nr:hypothetical protein NDU88_000462 [Pleurodeles waltl]